MFDVYQWCRQHRISETNADECANLVRKNYISNEKHNSIIEDLQKEYEQKIKLLKDEIKQLKEPNTMFEKIIEKIVCKHLSLDSRCEPYSGRDVELTWDKISLGSVTIDSYSED